MQETPEPITSRPERKRQSRERLTRAILLTMDEEGFHAVTTGRVTARAGLAQPSFYGHFRDIDQALEEIATSLGRTLDKAHEDASREATRALPREALRSLLHAYANTLSRDPVAARVFLKCRHDRATPMGRAWSHRLDRLREAVRSQILSIAPLLAPPTATAYTEVAVAAVLGSVEGFVEGRVRDLDEAITLASSAVIGRIHPDLRSADAA